MAAREQSAVPPVELARSAPRRLPSSGSPRASRHQARIDTTALARNLEGADPDAVVDLSADGYGHGAVVVATTALRVGSASFGVRSASERDALRVSGIHAEVLSGADIAGADAERIYGIGAEPVMRVSAGVVMTKVVDEGDAVSYGYTWRATRPTALALVPLGYADGVPRSAGNIAQLLISGRMRPIVGRIAMDVCVVEIGSADQRDEVVVGDEAVLFGETAVDGALLEQFAAVLRVPPLSITSGITSRVPRVAT